MLRNGFQVWVGAGEQRGTELHEGSTAALNHTLHWKKSTLLSSHHWIQWSAAKLSDNHIATSTGYTKLLVNKVQLIWFDWGLTYILAQSYIGHRRREREAGTRTGVWYSTPILIEQSGSLICQALSSDTQDLGLFIWKTHISFSIMLKCQSKKQLVFF